MEKTSEKTKASEASFCLSTFVKVLIFLLVPAKPVAANNHIKSTYSVLLVPNLCKDKNQKYIESSSGSGGRCRTIYKF